MGLVILSVLAVLYVGFIAFIFRRARQRRQTQAQGAADALAAAGARVGAVHASPGLWKAAVVDLTFDGRPGTFEIRPYSRDYDLRSIVVPAKPLPHVLLRRERASDRMGKQLGFNREVQLGDPAFDDAAYIDTAESDEVVRALLERPDVRAAVLAVLATGYRVEMSPNGLRATLIQAKLSPIDAAAVPRALAALEALAPLLPSVDPSSIGRPHWSRTSATIGVPLSVLLIGFVLTGLAGPFIHPLVDRKDALYGIAVGLGLWIAVVAALFLRLRGGTSSFGLLVLGAGLLLVSVPLAGTTLTFAANTLLDGSPRVAHKTKVVMLPSNPRKSQRVVFEGWRPGVATVNADVPRARLGTLKTGDSAEIGTRAGAFGWEWVEDVSF